MHKKKISHMIEQYKKFKDSKFIPIHFILINLILLISGFLFYIGYFIFSMLTFGEGANSFMYSRYNDLIFYIGIYLLPLLWILYKFKTYMFLKLDFRKAKDYILTIFSYSLIFILFLLYMHVL
jgi:hypothetical protein